MWAGQQGWCSGMPWIPLPGKERIGSGSWEGNKPIPRHPSWVLSKSTTSRDKRSPPAEEGGSSSWSKGTQVNGADSQALRGQERA